ncbi:MAG: response regulator transcription factor [Campylobacterota bacterium]
MQILIVEDDFLTAKFLQQSLTLQGYNKPLIADNAQDVLQTVANTRVDLVFMDINIKGAVDGLQLARQLWITHQSGIIFLTSYHDSETISEASLSKPLGFLIKPVSAADIEAVMMVAKQKLSAPKPASSDSVTVGPYSYEKKTRTICYQGKTIALSKLESSALAALIENHGTSISSQTLIQRIWGADKNPSALRELISRLRKKLPHIKIVRHSNIGYSLYS